MKGNHIPQVNGDAQNLRNKIREQNAKIALLKNALIELDNAMNDYMAQRAESFYEEYPVVWEIVQNALKGIKGDEI